MRLAHPATIASIGLLGLACAGCYSPSPYGMQYGYPQAPVQTLTPGNSYTPMPGGSYSTPTPGNQYYQPLPSGSPTYVPNGSQSDAPYFNNNNYSPTPYDGSGGSGGVPKPFDAGEVKFEPSKTPPVANEFNLNEHGSLEGVGASTANVAKIPLENAEFFEPLPSLPREPAPTSDAGVTFVPGGPAPYAYDADSYRWIRGQARYNPTTGNWSLIYSITPTEADRYHGWLTLVPDSRLSELEPNRAYLISGRLDPSEKDASGKPMYRVESLNAWDPSPTF
ncbi:MAG: hypothetical protein KF861_12755 [Planctomycetaceae bacterium]|nr:hypothetical protein [Planctomycetaceae bacterium]